jgi:hypothetical protein
MTKVAVAELNAMPQARLYELQQATKAIQPALDLSGRCLLAVVTRGEVLAASPLKHQLGTRLRRATTLVTQVANLRLVLVVRGPTGATVAPSSCLRPTWVAD